MTGSVELHRGKLILLVVLVCVASGAVSAFLGAFASLLYAGIHFAVEGPEAAVARSFILGVGTYWGATCGLAAALLWCRLVVRRMARAQTDRWVAWGAGAGVKVGILATAMLHVGLMLASVRKPLVDLLSGFAVGLVFGIFAGAILGAICGAICRALVRSSMANQTQVESTGGAAA